MTLLETVIAFVLLSVVGVACLDLSRGAAGLEMRSMEWSRAVATGEAALAAATADAALDDPAFRGVRIVRHPWRQGVDGIDEIDVSVDLPGGQVFRAASLVRASRALARGRAQP